MPKSMRPHRFVDTCPSCGLMDCFLQTRWIGMEPGLHSGNWITRNATGGKNILPSPFRIGIGILPIEGVWKNSFPKTIEQIGSVHFPDQRKVGLEAIDQRFRKHGYPIIASFPAPNDQPEFRKVNVFHTQIQAFHETNTRAIEKHTHQLMGASKQRKNAFHFFTGKHIGKMY